VGGSSRACGECAFRLQFGAPHLSVHRADLLGVLRRALKTVDFRRGARCI
jgi:hypothetical protein